MASFPVNPSPLGSASNIETSVDIYSDVEDEIDELDSDSESDELAVDSSTKKTGNGGERIPGHSLLPALRLENIIQADGVTGALSLSKEGLFVLSIATEEFIKRMAEAGHLHASAERRNAVSYRDMAATTQQYQEFMFLNDTIPAAVPLSEALLLREAKEKELLEEDPAMSASTSLHASASAPPTIAARPKAKSRANGPERVNGTASVGRRDRRSNSKSRRSQDNASEELPPAEGDVGWNEWADRQIHSPRKPTPDRPPVRNGVASTAIVKPSPLANSQSALPSRSGTNTPQLRDNPDEHASPPRPSPSRNSEETNSWPGPYTGPASGFLQGPGGPFSRVTQNPGRTIYSQQHRAE